MKIAIDATRGVIESAGIARYINELLANLAKIDQKNEYQLYYSFWRKDAEKFVKIKKISQKFAHLKSKFFRLPGSIKEFLYDQKIYSADNLSTGAEIYHAPTFMEMPINLKIPSIVTIHDMTTFLFPDQRGNSVSKKLSKKADNAIKNANLIIAVSKATKKDILKFCRINPQKIKVIYEAQNEIFVPNPKISRGNFILAVGTIEPRKNLARLISAYGKLPEKLIKGNPLYIVGGKGWNDSKIYHLAKPMSDKEYIKFLGFVSDRQLTKLYQRAKIFIYPSIYEGFGLPPLEAMACGAPVITSNVSSMPEIVGQAAIKINPYKTEEITNVLQNLLENDQLRDELSQKSLMQAKQFSWRKCARQTLKLYQDLAKGNYVK